MSTTSNSRAEALRLVALSALFAACVQAPVAPEAPLPSSALEVESKGPPAGTNLTHESVELVSAEVRTFDPAGSWKGEEALRDAEQPLLIEVRVRRPFGHTAQAAYPMIVWNGDVLHRSRIRRGTDDVLEAYLVSEEAVDKRNVVQVMWGGREETLTKRPIVVSAEQVVR